MTITKEELRKLFREYNDICFDGVLKMPSLLFKNNKDGVVGKFRYKKRNGVKTSPKIYINKCIQWTEDDLRDVLIHEMIHYYVIFILNWDGIFSHGLKFRTVRKKIQKEGIRVQILYRHLRYHGEKQ